VKQIEFIQAQNSLLIEVETCCSISECGKKKKCCKKYKKKAVHC